MQNSTPTNRTLSSIVGASLTLLDQVNTEGLVDSISVELSCTSGSALVDFQVLLQMTPDGDFFPLFVAADWATGPVGAMLAWTTTQSPATLTKGAKAAFILRNLKSVWAVKMEAQSSGLSTVTLFHNRVRDV